jgi:hypothetical protein
LFLEWLDGNLLAIGQVRFVELVWALACFLPLGFAHLCHMEVQRIDSFVVFVLKFCGLLLQKLKLIHLGFFHHLGLLFGYFELPFVPLRNF